MTINNSAGYLPRIFGILQSMTFAPSMLLTLLLQPVASPFTEDAPTIVGTGYRFTEGPAWVDGRFVFCDMSGDTVYSWSGKAGEAPKSIRTPSGRAVGTAAVKGGMVQVDTAGRRLIKWHPDKPDAIATFAEKFDGKKLGGMNDLASHPNGSVYVTHADWFLRPGDKEFEHSGVMRVDSKGMVSMVCDGLARPNGICFNPKGDVAYVTEYSAGRILAFDVEKSGTFKNQRVFADLNQFAAARDMTAKGGADGIRTDRRGNVFSTGPGGVWVLSPKGEFISHLPMGATNLAFGGKDETILLFTTGRGVASIGVKR